MLRTLLVVVLLFAGCSSNLQNIRTAATNGDPASQFQLGVAYDRGVETKQDLQEAAKWYRAAAEQGYAEAQNSLGSLYQAGEGVPKDYQLARMWYQKAADQGNVSAKNSLAYLYDLGLGVSTSPKTAARLYREAAELGEVRAMLNLGILLTQGKPEVEKDDIEAYKWLDLARFYTQTSKDMTLKWRVRGELDKLSGMMTTVQIEEGKKRGDEWARNHRKD
ncbi:tetratricopeptide repeat protein [Geomesophilobacter sediminis]|uniref:Sel1 repeat family protein n=1 Tax=Geomesophilobacter sediminis TaxID=2798584 RepID=A0A8J7LYA0_9BACT|nr:tetratricopeptide repeat protein [Geomesophilobacter sediminis]MBJ6724387.1 sel1 repeat family protein [Geomesophilobacter sediminis]